jgi:hypothetical protein
VLAGGENVGAQLVLGDAGSSLNGRAVLGGDTLPSFVQPVGNVLLLDADQLGEGLLISGFLNGSIEGGFLLHPFSLTNAFVSRNNYLCALGL